MIVKFKVASWKKKIQQQQQLKVARVYDFGCESRKSDIIVSLWQLNLTCFSCKCYSKAFVLIKCDYVSYAALKHVVIASNQVPNS